MGCDKVEEITSIDESLPNCKNLMLRWLKNLKKMPPLPPNLTYLEIFFIPQLSYFSGVDLLMKEERKQSILKVVAQMAKSLKLEPGPLPPKFLLIGSEIVKLLYPSSDDYSQNQLLYAWYMFMHFHIDRMFNKNEESKLVLPSSLTKLKMSECSITSDALSTSIQCLVSLSELELSTIQTITSLPSKEVLCLLENLRSLTIKDCYLLSSLGGIGALTSLKAFELNGCLILSKSDEPLPSSLESLKLLDCSNVDVILARSNLPVLRILHVKDVTFENRTGVIRALDVGNMPCLEYLLIFEWDGRLEGLNSLTALRKLLLLFCPEINPSSPMDKYAYALQQISVPNLLLLKLILSNETISSIDTLSIINTQGDSSDDEVFLSLTSLRCLDFTKCNITHLPKNLKNLASLKYITLYNCPNLCELELEELPRNLWELEIMNCPYLEEKFSKDGPYLVWFQQERTIVTFQSEEEGNHF